MADVNPHAPADSSEPGFGVNDDVVITDGPLAGIQGTVRSVDGPRTVAEVTLQVFASQIGPLVISFNKLRLVRQSAR